MVALGVSFIICIVWTLIAPDKNDNYDAYKTIELEDCEDINDTNADDPMAMNRALRACSLACPAVTQYMLCREQRPCNIVSAEAGSLGKHRQHDTAVLAL